MLGLYVNAFISNIFLQYYLHPEEAEIAFICGLFAMMMLYGVSNSDDIPLKLFAVFYFNFFCPSWNAQTYGQWKTCCKNFSENMSVYSAMYFKVQHIWHLQLKVYLYPQEQLL
jgi:hypothetical protein